MDDEVVSVYPETRPKIAHARSLAAGSGPSLTEPYSSVGALLAARAARNAERNWLTFQDEDGSTELLSYAEFWDQTRCIAGFMADTLDIGAGDRIATVMVNDPQTVLIYFAAWLLGATVVPINVNEDEGRISYILANARPKAVFALEAQCTRAAALLEASALNPATLVGVGREAPGAARSLEAGLVDARPLSSLPHVSADTPALIVYTSGTTGPPKGVVLDHGNLLADASSIAGWHRFDADDRAMCVLPIHHVNGIVVTLVTPLISGGSVVLCRRFHAQQFWATLAEQDCTWVSVVPTVLAFLCERHDDLMQFDLSRFRHIICGAGPLTVELARRFHEAFGIRVVHGYGLSETTCYSCFLPIDLSDEEYTHWLMERSFPSIGCPIPANEMAIHNDEGVPQPPGTRGEIVIRGHNVMQCYFQRPDANRDTFAHGWFRSGDEGYFEQGDDGRPYFFITGRLKELIIRGGINYSPFDIDEALVAIPGVKAAMAVGFENDFYGEEVGAYVQRMDGVDLTEESVIRACRERLPFAKSPKVVVFGDTFPVTSTGKYQRNRLKPLFAAWKGVQFRNR